MKTAKYIFLGLIVVGIIGFATIAIIDVPVPQKNVEISISTEKNSN